MGERVSKKFEVTLVQAVLWCQASIIIENYPSILKCANIQNENDIYALRN